MNMAGDKEPRPVGVAMGKTAAVKLLHREGVGWRERKFQGVCATLL